tara:strand:+ start:61396 stop:61938 length:543 start_codon:yes stop_codon:yes gene_type:complete
MKTYDCIFLDRDGTLNPDPGYINKIENFVFYDFAIRSLKKIAKIGNRFCIITNQSGIARGVIKKEALEEIHDFVRNEFERNSIELLGILTCTDLPSNPTDRRKPGPGMFFEAKIKYNLSLTNCLMIGDSICDIKAGANLGMDTMLVMTGNGKETLKLIKRSYQPNYIADNLYDGALQLCR